MTRDAVVVVLVGPQAAGKSTIATALRDAMVADGRPVSLVELDEVAGMAGSADIDSGAARADFARIVSSHVRDGVTVIAEGLGSADELVEFRGQLPAGSAVLSVAITASPEDAVSRAAGDPLRGVSKDPGFLAVVYGAWGAEPSRAEFDLVVDTSAMSITEATGAVRRAMSLLV